MRPLINQPWSKASMYIHPKAASPSRLGVPETAKTASCHAHAHAPSFPAVSSSRATTGITGTISRDGFKPAFAASGVPLSSSFVLSDGPKMASRDGSSHCQNRQKTGKKKTHFELQPPDTSKGGRNDCIHKKAKGT